MDAPADVAGLLGALALLIAVAHLGGVAASRAKLPAVVGELLAGVLLGVVPSAFVRSLRAAPLVDACAELGVALLLFDVGLELRTSELGKVGARAFGVAL